MKYELIPTVTLPTQEEVENIINQLKSELSGFDAHKSLSCVMVRELHKRLSKSIKCKVSINVTKECMDAMKHMVHEGMTQMQLAQEAIARLKSMSRQELISELVDAGIAEMADAQDYQGTTPSNGNTSYDAMGPSL